MKLKSKNVNINNLCDEIKYKLKEIEECCQLYNGKDYIMTITSGNDGKHIKDSLHYKDRAIDIRTKDMGIWAKATRNIIRRRLGWKYQVLWYDTHIHIEYQPERIRT